MENSIEKFSSCIKLLDINDDSIILARKLKDLTLDFKDVVQNDEQVLRNALNYFNKEALENTAYSQNFALLFSSKIMEKCVIVENTKIRDVMLNILQNNFIDADNIKEINLNHFYNSITLLGEYYHRTRTSNNQPITVLGQALLDLLIKELIISLQNYSTDSNFNIDPKFAKLILTQISLNGSLAKKQHEADIAVLFQEIRKCIIKVDNLSDSIKAFFLMTLDLYYKNFENLDNSLEKFYTNFLNDNDDNIKIITNNNNDNSNDYSENEVRNTISNTDIDNNMIDDKDNVENNILNNSDVHEINNLDKLKIEVLGFKTDNDIKLANDDTAKQQTLNSKIPLNLNERIQFMQKHVLDKDRKSSENESLQNNNNNTKEKHSKLSECDNAYYETKVIKNARINQPSKILNSSKPVKNDNVASTSSQRRNRSTRHKDAFNTNNSKNKNNNNNNNNNNRLNRQHQHANKSNNKNNKFETLTKSSQSQQQNNNNNNNNRNNNSVKINNSININNRLKVTQADSSIKGNDN